MRLLYYMRRETSEALQTPTMQLRASFFGTAGELAFSGFVYQMGGTLHRAQIRFVPKDAPIDATMPIPGRSPVAAACRRG